MWLTGESNWHMLQLDQLRRAGLVTGADYDRMKEKLLAKQQNPDQAKGSS
jgi:hypothetical protein